MSSGSLVFTERASSSDASRDRDGGDNRLAPYNPTHATAQSKALDLLELTPRDVLFDLGCGDGQLIIAALERCYDDDFLMRVHRERFAKLQLDSGEGGQNDNDDQQRQGPGQVRGHRHSQNSVDRSGQSGSTRKVDHGRSHSEYSVPHMMRSLASDWSDLDVSENNTPYNIPRINRHGQKGSEAISRGDRADVQSALSPMSSQQGMGTLTPNSPMTPIASNLRLRAGQIPTVMPSAERQKKQNNLNEDESNIPLTIEMPSLLALKDSLATVPSGSSMHSEDCEGVEAGGGAVMPGWTPYDKESKAREGGAGNEVLNEVVGGAGVGGAMGGGLRCVGIEYNQALAESAQSNMQKSYIYPHVEKKVCVRWGDVLEEWSRGRGEGFSADEHDRIHRGNNVFCGAREQIDLQHCVMKRNETCGDDGDEDARNLTLLEDATAVFVYLLPQGLRKVKPLLREAAVRRRRTQERRRREREQERQRHQQREWEWQQREQQQQEEYADLYLPLQQQSLHEMPHMGRISALTTDETLETLSPPPGRVLHLKDFSHLSDITSTDFLSAPTGSSVRTSGNSNNGMENIQKVVDAVERTAGKPEEEGPSSTMEDDSEMPSFRIVSYMFSVPGWTPTTVDRGSKGGCPLYLYENVHEETE